MNKPWVIWSFSALIALLVFGAMGAITQHTLGLEKKRAVAEARAELEERIRISLWRMDTAAAGILAQENNRPSWHFRDVDLRTAIPPSPLNLDVPQNVKLHFEVNHGQLSTPQINGWSAPEPSPVWENRQSQISQGLKLSQQKKGEWGELQHLLNNDDFYLGWQKKRNALSELADNNLGVISAVAQRGGENWKTDQPELDAKVAVAQQQRLDNPTNDIRSSKGYQVNYNAAEKAKRTEMVKNSSTNRQQVQSKADHVEVPVAPKSLPHHAASKEATVGDKAASGGQASTPTDQSEQLDEEMINPLSKQADDVTLFDTAHLSALTPVWLGDELILVREVQDASGKRIQAVWLNAKVVSKSLIDNISDLLPDARLEPVRQSLNVLLGDAVASDTDDPMVMAALPWRLLPGEVAVVEPAGWTPMRKTLAVAWIGALLAAVAAVVLLRGVVQLSERRASFVSSVTHELRTPLTTFSLYSDMLAEGMVQDEEKKKKYLLTLKRESERLTHLVENVLAYSRIERGSARARVESVRIATLMDRMCERLRTRADEAGMELHCEVDSQLAEREIKVDTTAVEQIIFNLVDNASKYAVHDDGEAVKSIIDFRALDRGKMVVLQVGDSGPGIARSERKKLFKAFHKSAQEAANSKPGVGLGLALCRRLARAMGGDLKIVESEQGACFELEMKDSK